MKTKRIAEVTENLIELVFTLNKKAINPMHIIKDSNMPMSHIKVIMLLKHRETMTSTGICKHLGLSKPNLTPIIDNLIELDLVLRETDENDRRRTLIKLSENGHEFIKDQEKKVKAKLAERLNLITDEELDIIDNSVHNLLDVFNKLL